MACFLSGPRCEVERAPGRDVFQMLARPSGKSSRPPSPRRGEGRARGRRSRAAGGRTLTPALSLRGRGSARGLDTEPTRGLGYDSVMTIIADKVRIGRERDRAAAA